MNNSAPHRGKHKRRLYRALVRRDGEVCANCKTTEALTIDHIVPRNCGGHRAVVNLQLLCWTCNQEKADSLELADLIAARLRPGWDATIVASSVRPKAAA